MEKTKRNYFVTAGLSLLLTGVCSAQTETKIPEDSLSVIVHNELHKKYSRYNINEILKVADKKENVFYKITVEKKTTQIELLYDKHGKFISKEKSRIYTFDGTEQPKAAPSKSNNDGHNH